MMKNSSSIGPNVKCRICGQVIPLKDMVMRDGKAGCPSCMSKSDVESAKESASIKPLPQQQRIIISSSKPQTMQGTSAASSQRKTPWQHGFDSFKKIKEDAAKPMPDFEEEEPETLDYICPRCKYSFKYNLIKRYPSSCPNCNNIIKRAE